jgi:hypothetical protein
MPVRFDLGPEPNRCTLHLSGVITAEDWKNGVELQIAAGAWTRRMLWDASEATDVCPGYRETEELIKFVRRAAIGRPPRGRMAMLAPVDVVYGSARMYQNVAVGAVCMEIAVVRTRAEAEEYLNA